MPPGTVATAPMLTNPTTSSVRPGMMMKSGHTFWVRSTPDITTSSAKTPTTTSTMPRAARVAWRGVLPLAHAAEGLTAIAAIERRVDRPVSAPDLDRLRDRERDEGLGLADGVEGFGATCQRGSDRRRENAAAAVRVRGLDPLCSQLDDLRAIEENIDHVVRVTALDDRGSRPHRDQLP